MEANKRRYQYEKYGTSYIEGNTVRKLNAVPDIRREEQPYELPSPRRQVQKQPRALQGISLSSLLVLTVAIIATLYVCVEYLKLQTEVQHMDKVILSKEIELSTMRDKNDAAFEQLDKAVDLDYIYQVAVTKLGMVYPNNNTVIAYQSPEENYARQYQDIPD